MGTKTILNNEEKALFRVAIDANNFDFVSANSESEALDSFVWDLGFKAYSEFKEWMQLRKLPGELSVKRIN